MLPFFENCCLLLYLRRSVMSVVGFWYLAAHVFKTSSLFLRQSHLGDAGNVTSQKFRCRTGEAMTKLRGLTFSHRLCCKRLMLFATWTNRNKPRHSCLCILIYFLPFLVPWYHQATCYLWTRWGSLWCSKIRCLVLGSVCCIEQGSYGVLKSVEKKLGRFPGLIFWHAL